MIDKVKKYILRNRELFIFIGILAVVFGSVMTVISIANNQTKPAANITPSINEPIVVNPNDPIEISEKVILPVEGEYNIVRVFYDETAENLEDAIIVSNTNFTESKGCSYAKKDNTQFEVLAVFSGKVITVTKTEDKGYIVEIKHSDAIVSRYSSLETVAVSQGDEIKGGDPIGTSAKAPYDEEAGYHIHLEILLNNKFINPVSVFGKTIDELTTASIK